MHVEARRGTLTQQHERGHVDREPEHADDDHWRRIDRRRVVEPHHCLDEHVRSDTKEEHRVGERGEDLEPVETERALPPDGRPGRGRHRGERHPDAERVGGHVARVAEHCERAADDADDDLDDEEPDDEHQRPAQPCRMPATGVVRMMVGVGHVPPQGLEP